MLRHFQFLRYKDDGKGPFWGSEKSVKTWSWWATQTSGDAVQVPCISKRIYYYYYMEVESQLHVQPVLLTVTRSPLINEQQVGRDQGPVRTLQTDFPNRGISIATTVGHLVEETTGSRTAALFVCHSVITNTWCRISADTAKPANCKKSC